MSEIADVLMGMRGLIKADPDKFQVYQDYFDLCRMLGKTDKAESYKHNLWIRNESAEKGPQRDCTRAVHEILRAEQKDIPLHGAGRFLFIFDLY